MTKTARRKRRQAHRRFIRGAVLGSLGFCTKHAVDSHGVNPEWLELVELPLAIPNLSTALSGLRLVHISDLHLSTTVSEEYIKRCITRINRLEPDVVVLTGDYITYDASGRFKEKIIRLVGNLNARLGVFATLGNHDYGVFHRQGFAQFDIAEQLSDGLSDQGVRVLRNQACSVKIKDDRLWLVGLGDLWSRDLDPRLAFAGSNPKETRIALSHNPNSIHTLAPFHPDIVLSGHTHGRKAPGTILGTSLIPPKTPHYRAGMFLVGDTRLYVNRGLGRLGRPRFNCPPEITLFTLRHTA